MTVRCPTCGSVIRPDRIPAVRDATFECHHCRSQLSLKPPGSSLPLLLGSALTAVGVAVGVHLHGLVFGAAVMAFTLVLNYVAQSLRNNVKDPKLQPAPKPTSAKPFALQKRAHVSR